MRLCKKKTNMKYDFKRFWKRQVLAQASKEPISTNISGCFKSTNISGHFKSTHISGHFKLTNISGHFKSPHLGRIFGCLDTDRWLDSLHPRHLKRFVKSQFTMFVLRTRKKRPKVLCCAKLPFTQNAKDVSKITQQSPTCSFGSEPTFQFDKRLDFRPFLPFHRSDTEN